MLNKLLACLFVILILAGCATMAQAGETSAIAWLMGMYGGTPSEEALEWIAASYEPETVDFGDVTITFDEVLCDGRWLYTSVIAAANDPDTVLLVPGSAWLDDLVSGGYGEGLRDDDRSFIDAATQDGKRLVMVYAYPALLNTLPEYFLDHFQLAEEKSILLSGGMVSLEGGTLKTDWYVFIFDVDPQTGIQIDETVVEALHPLVSPILMPTERQKYRVSNAASEDIPFKTITLVKTPLAVYTEVDWIIEEDYFFCDYTLLDADGVEYPRGASSEVYTFTMDVLPHTLLMPLIRQVNGNAETITVVLETMGTE